MKEKNITPMFSRDNYLWMLAGIIVLGLGMFLMSGGTSNNDPAVFDRSAVYSFTRITVAPILVILGLLIEVFAIFKTPRSAKD